MWTKHPCWTIRAYLTRPLPALENTLRASLCFVWTAVIGTILLLALAKNALRGKRERNLPILFELARPWGKWTLRFAGVGLRFTKLGSHDPEKSYVIVANHQSTLDIPVIPLLSRKPLRVVAKMEVKKFPFVGWVAYLADQIFIDRNDHEQATRTIQETLARDPGTSIFFFAEGHRTRDGVLQPFKMGAFHAASSTGLPILPVVLDGGYDLLEAGSLLRLRAGGEIRVTFCPTIENTRGKDPKTLRDQTCAAINSRLDLRRRNSTLPQ